MPGGASEKQRSSVASDLRVAHHLGRLPAPPCAPSIPGCISLGPFPEGAPLWLLQKVARVFLAHPEKTEHSAQQQDALGDILEPFNNQGGIRAGRESLYAQDR